MQLFFRGIFISSCNKSLLLGSGEEVNCIRGRGITPASPPCCLGILTRGFPWSHVRVHGRRCRCMDTCVVPYMIFLYRDMCGCCIWKQGSSGFGAEEHKIQLSSPMFLLWRHVLVETSCLLALLGHDWTHSLVLPI